LTNFQAVETREGDYEWKWPSEEAKEAGKGKRRLGGEDAVPEARRLEGARTRRRYYTVGDPPPGVPLDFVRMLDKPTGEGQDHIYALFRCKGDCKTIFTPESLRDMNRFSQEVSEHPLWYKHCAREQSTRAADAVGCGKNSYANLTKEVTRAADLKESTTQEELDEALIEFAPEVVRNGEARRMLSKNFSVEWPFSPYVSVVFRTSGVIADTRVRKTTFGFWEETVSKRYEGGDRDRKQLEFSKAIYDLSLSFESEHVEVVAFSDRFRREETAAVIHSDAKYIAFVLLACFTYLSFHTKSTFLGLVSLINILMSIPVCLVIYNYVLRITYFSSLHLAVIFIVLGVGCDDVFVFHDFWMNSFQYKALRREPILRLSLTARQASSTMFVTSLTSSVAFASCTFSEIMPIASFGWFATLIVPCVYLQTIFVLPLVYYFYEVRIMKMSCCGCFRNCFSKNKTKVENFEEEIDLEKLLRMAPEPVEEDDSSFDYLDYIPHATEGAVQTFFHKKFSKWVFKARKWIAFLGLFVYAVNIYGTT
jgi:predicted RND superfamily exporter protein